MNTTPLPTIRPVTQTHLSVNEVSEILNEHPATLVRWRQRGEGPPWRRFSRSKILYSREGLTAFINPGFQPSAQQ